MRRTALNLPTIDRIRRVVLDQSSECLGDDGFWFRAARVYVLSARSRALASARAYAPGQARERVSRPHLSSGATMLAALDRCRNRRFSSPTATGRNSTTESFETFPVCRIDCGPGHPRDVCSPVSVRSDMGMIRFRRMAGRIRDDSHPASSTKGRIANADGAGRFENRMRRPSLPRWSRSWSSLSGSHGLGDVVGPSLHHASPSSKRSLRK